MKRSIIAILAAIVFLLSSCSQAETSIRTITSPGGAKLVPYTSKRYGFRGVLPEGWIEAMPGIFIAKDDPNGSVQLFQLAYPKLAKDIVIHFELTN